MKFTTLRIVNRQILTLLFTSFVLITCMMLTLTTYAQPEELELGLETQMSENISGYKGTKRKLFLDNRTHGLDGISLAERKDNPCWIRISTQDINDSAHDGQNKHLCGKKATSRKMKVQYRDNMRYGPRVFITGVRVCTNKKQNRIKGIQLAGKKILDDGALVRLGQSSDSGTTIMTQRVIGGGRDDPITKAVNNIGRKKEHQNDPEHPTDWRNNCDKWHKWASCPADHQIATGVVAHFEAGKEPRSITGLELMCRSVWSTEGGTGAVRSSWELRR